IDQGDYTRAEEHLVRSREGFMRTDQKRELATSLALQGTIYRLVGDATAARFWCERAVELMRKTEDGLYTAMCLTHLAGANQESDRGQEAVDQLVEARSLAQGVGAIDTAHSATIALARCLLELERTDDVLPLLDDLFHRAKSAALAADLPEVLFIQAAYRVQSGDDSQARHLCREALDRASVACAAEAHWELRIFCASLLTHDEPDRAETLRAEAEAWAESCAAKLGQAIRRDSFLSRLRERRSVIERLAVTQARAEPGNSSGGATRTGQDKTLLPSSPEAPFPGGTPTRLTDGVLDNRSVSAFSPSNGEPSDNLRSRFDCP
ncbi:MAG: tetratricopeptide repeat protein, partial [Acidobacteriota bacterium]